MPAANFNITQSLSLSRGLAPADPILDPLKSVEDIERSHRADPILKLPNVKNKANMVRSNWWQVDQSIPPSTIPYAYMSYKWIWGTYFLDYVEEHWHALLDLWLGTHQLESSIISYYCSWQRSLLWRIFGFQTKTIDLCYTHILLDAGSGVMICLDRLVLGAILMMFISLPFL